MSGYLKKNLKEGKSIIKCKNFPFNIKKYAPRHNLSLIGIGGNLGDCKRRFNKLFILLKREKLVNIVATSIIYKNPPFGFLQQPYFYNSLILIDTKLKPLELLRYTQNIEKRFKRKREFKDSPRTLDLDIIFYEKIVLNKAPKLIIPHPRWSNRDSVLIPLEFLKGNRCLKRVL